MTEVLVYATTSRAQVARTLLSAACQTIGIGARLELYGTGSLYQRLGPRHAPPLPDIVMWFGPFAAQAASLDGLLQSYQPVGVADQAAHEPNWRWTTLDYATVGSLGTPPLRGLDEAVAAPGLAMADPERSEAGMAILLCTLDRARQVDGDVERGWAWWQQRVRAGVVLGEDDAEAAATVADAGANHALTVADSATPLAGLAPIPHAIGLAANSRNPAAAKQMLDWLTGPAAGDLLRASPWQASRNGLQASFAAAPALDIEWARQQYTAARQRWAQSGFAPSVRG